MKIFIAKENMSSGFAFESLLKSLDLEIITVFDGETVLELMQSDADNPLLVILDWILSGVSGIDICRRIRQQVRKGYVYIILLISKDDNVDLKKGFESGADDCILKPHTPYELQARVKSGKRILELQTELMNVRESLRFQASHDPLTNVLNRVGIMEILQRELSRAYRCKTTLSLFMIDLDHFKNVNDNHGHLVGDEVLCKTSIRISSKIREYDSFGRFGGEEFLIILPECNESESSIIAERIRACMENAPIVTSKVKINITASLGVATYHSDYKIDAKVIVHASDSALYRAKKEGRNKVVLATTEDFDELSGR